MFKLADEKTALKRNMFAYKLSWWVGAIPLYLRRLI